MDATAFEKNLEHIERYGKFTHEHGNNDRVYYKYVPHKAYQEWLNQVQSEDAGVVVTVTVQAIRVYEQMSK